MHDNIFSPTVCVIDTGAIQRNFKRLGAPERLLPVIKSDAYGHGLLQTAHALREAGACHFAVGMVQEGEILRLKGFRQEIIALMGCLDEKDWRLCATSQLTPLLHDFHDFSHIDSCGAETMTVAIKADTGMSRLGFGIGDLPLLIEWLRARPRIRPVYCVSHLACADASEKEDFTAAQAKLFNQFFFAIKQHFPEIMPSLGNSAMTIRNEGMGLLRPGLAIYGGNPIKHSRLPGSDAKLEWAMSLRSKVLAIRKLKAGQSVSYGAAYTAPIEMTIAIVGIGYSQGYPRLLSGKGSALINGRLARQTGRICMGMSMFDVSGIPGIQQGDDVLLAGGNEEKDLDIGAIARLANTIPYELLCSFGTMNRREYIKSPVNAGL